MKRSILFSCFLLFLFCSKSTEPPQMFHYEGTLNPGLTEITYRSSDSTYFVDLRSMGFSGNIDDNWMRELLIDYNDVGVWEEPSYYHRVVWFYDGPSIQDKYGRLRNNKFMVNLIKP